MSDSLVLQQGRGESIWDVCSFFLFLGSFPSPPSFMFLHCSTKAVAAVSVGRDVPRNAPLASSWAFCQPLSAWLSSESLAVGRHRAPPYSSTSRVNLCATIDSGAYAPYNIRIFSAFRFFTGVSSSSVFLKLRDHKSSNEQQDVSARRGLIRFPILRFFSLLLSFFFATATDSGHFLLLDRFEISMRPNSIEGDRPFRSFLLRRSLLFSSFVV